MSVSPLGRFNREDEIARFVPGTGAAGRRAETLVKIDRLRLVLVTMRAEAVLEEHSAPGPITIHALRGRFAVGAGGEEWVLGPGQLVALASGVRHRVHGQDAGAFLLTIAPEIDR